MKIFYVGSSEIEVMCSLPDSIQGQSLKEIKIAVSAKILSINIFILNYFRKILEINIDIGTEIHAN